MVHKITISQTAKVGKAPDALARVPEMMDTPPILWFDERKGVASGYALFIWRASCGIATNPYNLGSCTAVESDLCGMLRRLSHIQIFYRYSKYFCHITCVFLNNRI